MVFVESRMTPLRLSSSTIAYGSSSPRNGRSLSSLPSEMKPWFKPKLKLKTALILCGLALIIGYSMTTNAKIERRARQLLEEKDRLRELITIDKGGGECDIGSPVEDAPNVPAPDSTKTLLVSYPGSGKRFLWTIIKAMTNYEVADDWDFSEKLTKNPLTIKSSWPHMEGTWSWKKDMDQVVLLIRNPRRAIPSYHTMRWELDYAKDWGESFLHIPDTYMERPEVTSWEAWRDEKFNREMDAWFNFYDFWMQDGYQESEKRYHDHCYFQDIDCQPKELVDFESLYTWEPSDDFHKIGTVLDSLNNVEVISSQARACVLHNVMNRTGHQDLNMHQASRPFPERPALYDFTIPQFDRMFNRTITLRDKYSTGDLAAKPQAATLVGLMDKYIVDNKPEYYLEVEAFLAVEVQELFGVEDCESLEGVEVLVCQFMKDTSNHVDFFEERELFPDDFSYYDWLRERSILVRLYYNTGGENWKNTDGWLGPGNHCTQWYGIDCTSSIAGQEYRVTKVALSGNNLVGDFPIDIKNLDLLEEMLLDDNELENQMPGSLCRRSTGHPYLYIHGDGRNCHNNFDNRKGFYRGGCCDFVLIDVPFYLNSFVEHQLGAADANCDNLDGVEVEVCNFIKNEENHDIFKDGFPYDQKGLVWDFMIERSILVRMYLTNGGSTWTKNGGWYGPETHCQWEGISCNGYNWVRTIEVDEYGLTGPYPQDLERIAYLRTIDLSFNSLTGEIPDDICYESYTRNAIDLTGDGSNCPNDFNFETGTYIAGCCDTVVIDVDIYLNNFAENFYGSSNCDSLGGTDTDVCNYMIDRANHDLLVDKYPTGFSGDVWLWLQERSTLVQIYLSTGGAEWSIKDGWLTGEDHCNWHGITCTDTLNVNGIDLGGNQLEGEFPNVELNELESLSSLKISVNTLSGLISNNLCDASELGNLYIDGDDTNCPNLFDSETGQYLAGCCDVVQIDVDGFLSDFARSMLPEESNERALAAVGDANCNSLDGLDADVCKFMTEKSNHAIFADGYPYDFGGNLWDWMKERAILVRMYMSDTGKDWTVSTGWLSTDNHCTWHGLTCNDSFGITELNLKNNQLAGPYPMDIGSLSNLISLNLNENSLVGSVPADICAKSISNLIHVTGDADNCPNDFQASTGEYLAGCCDNILIHADKYLKNFAKVILGSADCRNLEGSEVGVCGFMAVKENHEIFKDGYPYDFDGNVWEYIKERAVLVRMYLNTGGRDWADSSGWMTKSDHCTWYGVTCNSSHGVGELNLQKNKLSGPFPEDLGNLESLVVVKLNENFLTGNVPDDVCTKSTSTSLQVHGDITNCPNDFQTDEGGYVIPGCCDNVRIDVDIFLMHFTGAVLGDTNCINLEATESKVCKFISDKSNHDIFDDGYPYDYDGNLWEFVKERAILAKIYFGNGGERWTEKTGWLSKESHCNWFGISCSDRSSVMGINLEGNQLEGPIPQELINLNDLGDLIISSNSMSGFIPDEICALSEEGNIHVKGDHMNCQNGFDSERGEYAIGCCDIVIINVDTYLSDFVATMFGDASCGSLEGKEAQVCDFISNKANHDIFTDGYPYGFNGNVWSFLKERTILARMYLYGNGESWVEKKDWMGSDNHCLWQGVLCTSSHSVSSLSLQSNEMNGPFPSDLAGLEVLENLNLSRNSFTGAIPDDLCSKSFSGSVYISGDSTNCPNTFMVETGILSPGCCNEVVINFEEFIGAFASSELGGADCDSLEGIETDVCNFMTNVENHELFDNGYPSDFTGHLWEWLKERSILVRMYLATGGASWSTNTDWMSNKDHCDWYGIVCGTDDAFSISDIDLSENKLSGPFPNLASLRNLDELKITSNSLTGVIPESLCAEAESGILSIEGDDTNCPNKFDSSKGEYAPGCCDFVTVNVDTYLNNFVHAMFGDSCDKLDGVNADACQFMINKQNHGIFADGYPYLFDGDVWEFMKERTLLVEMYLNNGGSSWKSSIGWLVGDHCEWHGVECTSTMNVAKLDMEGNGLTGPFPNYLEHFSNLESINFGSNGLDGSIVDSLCQRPTLYVIGDSSNCAEGCCDIMHDKS